MKAAAQREADQLRLGAQQEANDLRVTAKREAEQVRAGADREVQEARRTLAVEKERLAREAAEHHASATAETDAAGRGGRAARRPPPSSEPARRPPRPPPTASRRTPSPRRTLPGPVARPSRSSRSARTQADSLNARPGGGAARAGRASVPRSTGITKRRDAITAQLASLRDVVAGFGERRLRRQGRRLIFGRRPAEHATRRASSRPDRQVGTRAPRPTPDEPDPGGRDGPEPRSARPLASTGTRRSTSASSVASASWWRAGCSTSSSASAAC